jgi:hypothetical protein
LLTVLKPGTSEAVADMQVCCVASRCAAPRRGLLRPFLRSPQWRSLHLMCRFCLHRCPTRSRSSRGDLLAQLSAGTVRLRLGACSDRLHQLAVIGSHSSARSYWLARSHLAVISSQSLARSHRVAVHQLAVIWSHSVGSQSHWLAIQARCHRLQGSARSHPLAVRRLAVNGSLYRLAVTVAGISSQSSHSHQLAVISSQSSARSHRHSVIHLQCSGSQ